MEKKRIGIAILIGFFGSLGIATLSDSIMPYIGELLLGLPHSEAHIGFIEEPLTTFGAAFLGVAIGYFYKHNRFPHTGHVLISTWASLFHVLMALGGGLSVLQMVGIFVLLALAVWFPCCLSDIIFPLLFSDKKKIHSHHGKEHHTHSS